MSRPGSKFPASIDGDIAHQVDEIMIAGGGFVGFGKIAIFNNSGSPARLRKQPAVRVRPIVDATKEERQGFTVRHEKCIKPWIVAKGRPFEWRADDVDHAGV